MRSTVLLLAFLVAGPSGVASQLPAWLRPGARLRLTTAPARPPVIGTLVRFDREAVSVRPDGGRSDLMIPLAAVHQVDVSRERGSHAATGMRTGFLVGAGVGVLAVASDDVTFSDKGLAALLFGSLFGVIGAGVGGLAGAAIPTDVWEPISLSGAGVHVAPVRDRLAVGLSFTL